jgi:hypothetical protein
VTRDGAGVVELLAAILRGTPRLDGCLCSGRHTLFDLEVDGDQYEYVADTCAATCFRCPALNECAEWAAAQPSTRLSGVVAGRVYSGTRKAA